MKKVSGRNVPLACFRLFHRSRHEAEPPPEMMKKVSGRKEPLSGQALAKYIYVEASSSAIDPAHPDNAARRDGAGRGTAKMVGLEL